MIIHLLAKQLSNTVDKWYEMPCVGRGVLSTVCCCEGKED
jgi:hypothetical protein